MKRLFALLLAMVVILSMSACGNNAQKTPNTSNTGTAENFV